MTNYSSNYYKCCIVVSIYTASLLFLFRSTVQKKFQFIVVLMNEMCIQWLNIISKNSHRISYCPLEQMLTILHSQDLQVRRIFTAYLKYSLILIFPRIIFESICLIYKSIDYTSWTLKCYQYRNIVSGILRIFFIDLVNKTDEFRDIYIIFPKILNGKIQDLKKELFF